MKIRHQLAQHLIDVHRGNNWTEVCITDILKDVSWVQASIIPPFSPNSIAMLLHHITYWNRIVMQRAMGQTPEINPENGMNAPVLKSDVDWQQLQIDNLHSCEELANIIEGYDPGNILSPILPGHSSAYRNFQGQVEHIHYHLGQIQMIKKFLNAQKG